MYSLSRKMFVIFNPFKTFYVLIKKKKLSTHSYDTVIYLQNTIYYMCIPTSESEGW